jgi:hypothetical protein
MKNNTTPLETRTVSAEELTEISKKNGSLRVRLFVPVHNNPPESEQNPKILRQLI